MMFFETPAAVNLAALFALVIGEFHDSKSSPGGSLAASRNLSASSGISSMLSEIGAVNALISGGSEAGVATRRTSIGGLLITVKLSGSLGVTARMPVCK